MRIVRLFYPRDHELVLAGDLHDGLILSDLDGFKECLSYVESSPRRRLLLMGDLQEARTLDHPYFNLSEIVENGLSIPDVSYEHVREVLRPLADKIDVVLLGNHEWELRKFGNMTAKLARDLSTPDGHQVYYGTMSCVVEIYDENDNDLLLYKLLLHHGFGRITSQAKDFEQQQGNKKAKLKLMLKELAGDCVIMAMGHTHQDIVVPPTGKLYLYHEAFKVRQGYLDQGSNARYIDPDRRWYINTGSFLVRSTEKLGYDGLPVSGYPERFGYPPLVRAFITVEVANGVIQDVKKMRIGEF
jgi:hypothetical protein